MAGSSSGRSLEQTPTWAVAVVCFLLLVISIFIEHIIHLIGNWFKKKHKRALYESLEKIKSELMLLGFISLLLTIGQGLISQICIPASVGATWHPCSQAEEEEDVEDQSEDSNRRRLLSVSNFRRVLAVTSSSNTTDTCAAQGKVPFISADGIHQLHIFIFILGVFHVLYCVMTMALGRAKMGKWKKWEKETRTAEYQFSHDPERFRFTRETSFGRRHLNAWSKISVLVWIVCFFRQFLRSVPKVDYLTLRHGFIMAHLAPHSQTQFDFQKYINRSLEEDFKVVVGISPPIWFLAVLFLLFNTHGWYSYLWLPFIPLVVILLVGTKLQVIVTQMGLRIQDRGEVVRGVPAVEPGDDLFWFNRPRLILYLINYVLFQNAFQLAFLAWSWFEFGFASCFHRNIEDVVIRISMGVLIQILCSYVTLPLYALVIQMGSTMKPTIFNARVAAALKRWHRGAQKHIRESKNNSNFTTPLSSSPATPTHSFSPVHLLRHPHRSDNNNYCLHTSPRRSDFDNVNNSDTEAESPSPSYFHQHGRRPRGDGSSSSNYHQRSVEHEEDQVDRPSIGQIAPVTELEGEQHEIDIESKEFSFDKRTASI